MLSSTSFIDHEMAFALSRISKYICYRKSVRTGGNSVEVWDIVV